MSKATSHNLKSIIPPRLLKVVPHLLKVVTLSWQHSNCFYHQHSLSQFSTLNQQYPIAQTLFDLITSRLWRINFLFLSLPSNDPIANRVYQAFGPLMEKCLALDPEY